MKEYLIPIYGMVVAAGEYSIDEKSNTTYTNEDGEEKQQKIVPEEYRLKVARYLAKREAKRNGWEG